MPATLDKQALAEQYGWMYALLKSDKSLWHTFSRAVAQGWDGPTFQSQIRRTSWWRKHSDAWKRWKALTITNPREATARTNRLIASLQDSAAEMGARPSTRQLNIIAHHALAFGWSDAQVKNQLAHFVKIYHGYYAGQAAENAQNLRTLGAKLGYNWTTKGLETAVQHIAGGNSTVQTVESRLRRIAAGAFPSYAKQILDGMDPLDIAAPYIDSASRLLEKPQAEYTLNNPLIRRAMQFKNVEGKPAELGLAEFEESVRRQADWRSTKNAQDSAAAVVNNLLTKWRLIA